LPPSMTLSYDGDDMDVVSPPIKAPGMLMRHYAPRTPLRLNACHVGDDDAALLFGTSCPAGGMTRLNLSPRGDMREAAANFYRMLHQLDRTACRCIAVMPIPEEGLGLVLNERLRRASHTPSARDIP